MDILNRMLKFDSFWKLAVICLYFYKVKPIPEANSTEQVSLSFDEIQERRLSKIIPAKGYRVVLGGKDSRCISLEGIAQKFNLINSGDRNDHMCDGSSTADRMDSQIYYQLIAW